ncbi:MAG: FMN-binding glutamate synthase family protein [Candidatus Sericytochromatia bacterium]
MLKKLMWLGGAAVAGIAARDVLQRKHAIRHNFPVLGNFRYLIEKIGPELRQYIVANDKEETPFNRAERRWVYASAKGENNMFGFGSTEVPPYDIGYPLIKHAAFPMLETTADKHPEDPSAIPCLKVIGARHGRRRPYRPGSVINLSAMSFGSLGENAVRAFNKGALAAGCFHNTGEGGVSPYHLQGADVVWQLGTGYFGARDAEGNFSLDKLLATVQAHPQIRMIEIKLSQGAKPGKGGVLPGRKVTPEIAQIRGIPVGKDCLSPNAHTAFNTVQGLIDFVEQIAQASGLPVGIKSAVGELAFWELLAHEMKGQQRGPDYIAIDGGEGGTGAAPLVFSDHVGMPFNAGFAQVYRIFHTVGIAEDLVWIGSAKLGFPDRAIVAFAMGCDMINVAREAMMSIGCIQAQHCHTDFCPAGVATQNKWLQAGLDIEDKAARFARYVQSFRKELLSVSHAAGHAHPALFRGGDIDISLGNHRLVPLDEVVGYVRQPGFFTRMADYTPVDITLS